MPEHASTAGGIAPNGVLPCLPVAFLAVSCAPGGVADPAGPGGEQRVRAAAALLTGAPPAVAVPGDLLAWVRAARPQGALSRPDGSARELSALLASATPEPPYLSSAAARALAAPFALVSCAGRGRPLVALTDQLGIRQLYWYQGDGWAGLSTSSQALSWCAQAGLAHDAIAVRAFLGFHLGSDTPFAGVAALPGARYARWRAASCGGPSMPPASSPDWPGPPRSRTWRGPPPGCGG